MENSIDNASLTKEKHCISCFSTNFEALGKYYPDQLCRCKNCNLVQFTKIPTTNELVAHYENYPVSGVISSITKKRYSELLDQLDKYKVTGKILDIGCGEGFFLDEARKRGWEVHGTEFAEKYISICEQKGIKMKHGKLNPVNYENNCFDVITWFEVIEHINYPTIEIENISSILRPGGALYITTPNFNSLSRHWLKGKWSVIEYPEHLSYYTPKTLGSLLLNQGFKKIFIKTTGISPGRISQSVGQLQSETFHDVDREWQRKLEKNVFLKLAKSFVNIFLNITRSGDSMKALFVKSK